jgi:hypothetical protein
MLGADKAPPEVMSMKSTVERAGFKPADNFPRGTTRKYLIPALTSDEPEHTNIAELLLINRVTANKSSVSQFRMKMA